LIAFVLLCLLALTAFAATRQWSIDTPGQIYQVVGDGKGGCAFVWITTGDVPTVVWADKKGAIIHQKTLSVHTWPFPITQCTPKQLNYLSEVGGGNQLVQVDKKGQETSEPASGVVVNGGFPFTLSRAMDKKGFFTIELNTNTPAMPSKLIRYSNK
jgi:hypothetical protein